MTKGEIITRAQLWLDDSSELSTSEFSDLFDTNLRKINRALPWEGLKAEGTGTTSTTVPYVALATDFMYLLQNHNYTDSSEAASRPVIFRGTTYTPYQVVSWSDRRQYRNKEGYAYIDFPNSRLVFTNQPSLAESVEYDYFGGQAALTDTDEPWFPEVYQDQLFHMMVSDDICIQSSDKAKSYRSENLKLAKDAFDDMVFWNSQLVQI